MPISMPIHIRRSRYLFEGAEARAWVSSKGPSASNFAFIILRPELFLSEITFNFLASGLAVSNDLNIPSASSTRFFPAYAATIHKSQGRKIRPSSSLLQRSINDAGLDPASLQVNRRARRVKTGRIDVLMLVRALIAIDRGDRHVCAIVNVPSIEEEDARRSHRERQRLIRERTAHINRIKGLLFGQGVRGVEPARRKRIDFSVLRTGEGRPLADRLRAEREREYARLDLIDTQLRAVEAERDTADAQDAMVERKRNMLLQLRGIGPASAAILAREIFGRSFANRRQLGSYLGLTPSAYDSGSVARCQGISKAGNSFARRVMVEVAWLWRKYQPASALAKWYDGRAAGQSPRIRRIMLIAPARKLIVALWRYVEIGLIPDGVDNGAPGNAALSAGATA